MPFDDHCKGCALSDSCVDFTSVRGPPVRFLYSNDIRVISRCKRIGKDASPPAPDWLTRDVHGKITFDLLDVTQALFEREHFEPLAECKRQVVSKEGGKAASVPGDINAAYICRTTIRIVHKQTIACDTDPLQFELQSDQFVRRIPLSLDKQDGAKPPLPFHCQTATDVSNGSRRVLG